MVLFQQFFQYWTFDEKGGLVETRKRMPLYVGRIMERENFSCHMRLREPMRFLSKEKKFDRNFQKLLQKMRDKLIQKKKKNTGAKTAFKTLNPNRNSLFLVEVEIFQKWKKETLTLPGGFWNKMEYFVF